MPARDPEQDALRRSEQRFRAAFQQQFQFMAILSPDGRVLEFNQQLGHGGPEVPRAQVIGELFWRTVWWRDREDMQAVWPQRLRDAAARTGPLLTEDRFTSSTGELRHASAAITAVRDEAGRIDCFIVQAADITERRRAEALQQALDTQLRETQKLEAIGTLAGGIAHDFNNILAAIVGNVALARDAIGPDHPAHGPLGEIRKAGRRARNLVHQILAFSRRQPHERVAMPLRPLVDETLSLMRATLPSGVELVDTTRGSDAAWILGDATQIQQVLMNLCTNAWHALREGHGRIEVGLAVTPGESVALSVADDGVGMDAATLARIFEPFFTTKPRGEGTGLGLSVVHGIVAEHGGRLAVDSAPGRGSRFTVHLPLADAREDSRIGGDSALAPLDDGGGRRVLYVDDDEALTLVVEALLRRAGFEVVAAQQATDALAIFAADPQAFDIVVTDYNMPRLSGIELTQALRRWRDAIPVIVTSGYVSDELREAARAAGVEEILNKENTFEELSALILEVLGRRAA